MSKRHFKLMLDGEIVKLRLTAAGQRSLREELDEDILETVLDAATDSGKLSALLGAALNWKGNANSIRNGEELFDRLVDEGWGGQAQFGGLALDIAAASGVLSEEQAEQAKRMLGRAVDEAFRQLSEGEAEAVGEMAARPALLTP